MYSMPCMESTSSWSSIVGVGVGVGVEAGAGTGTKVKTGAGAGAGVGVPAPFPSRDGRTDNSRHRSDKCLGAKSCRFAISCQRVLF